MSYRFASYPALATAREAVWRRSEVSVKVCHKCAVRFDPICANSLRFNTGLDCFRAGLIVGKLLTLKDAKT